MATSLTKPTAYLKRNGRVACLGIDLLIILTFLLAYSHLAVSQIRDNGGKKTTNYRPNNLNTFQGNTNQSQPTRN